MKFFILIVVIMGSFFSIAQNAQKSHSGAKHAHKHVHGEVEGSLAFEGAKGQFEFEIPGHSFVGFEHMAKSEQHKNDVKNAVKTFEAQFFKMIQTEPSCSLNKIEVENKVEGKHSAFEIKGDIVCNKAIKGTTLKFDFKTHFKNFESVDLQVIADDVQKSIVVKTKDQKLDLK